MAEQIFYIKHSMDFDVNRLLGLFFQRPFFRSLPDSVTDKFRTSLFDLLSYIQSPSGQRRPDSEIFVAEAYLSESKIEFIFTNCGSPLNLNQFRDRFKNESQVTIASNSEDRSGQKIHFLYLLPSDIKTWPQKNDRLSNLAGEDLAVRELNPGEEFLVSKLFYNVYRYRYINTNVYDPELIAEQIHRNRLISYVGTNAAGEIISHVGLVLCNDNPVVYEAAWGVVDPRYANRGIFRKTFEAALSRMQELPMSYSIYDFVTNHDFSQRLVSKYGYNDLAIFVGNQVSDTQARLDGDNLEGVTGQGMERYSLLLGIDQRHKFPFGARIALPVNIGETCEFLLTNLGMSWEPTNRFASLPTGGRYSALVQQEQKSVIFDLFEVGRTAVEQILSELSHHLKSGLEYAAVDFPLNVPGVGYLHDALADAGFFMAGLIPYRFTNQLGFRMQFLTPTDINFNSIKIHSPTGKRLLQIIKEEWERNHLI